MNDEELCTLCERPLSYDNSDHSLMGLPFHKQCTRYMDDQLPYDWRTGLPRDTSEPPLYYCLDCDRGFTTLHAYNSELHLPCPGRRRNA